MPEERNVPFRPRARLLSQLGDQLIRNEKIALFELVKNAYDADSRSVTVTLRQAHDMEKGSITVRDYGTGMDIDTIINSWMEPGTDYREKEFNERKRTKKYKRLPIGEKGVGRFAAAKLGHVLELVTRKEGNLELVLKVDWRDFENVKYLSRVKVNIRERKPRIYKKRTGTRLKITQLRNPWTDGMIRDAYRSITTIVDPFFSKKSKFRVRFKCPDRPQVLEGLISPDEIKNLALWRADCWMEDSTFSIKYDFEPWPNMDQNIPPRTNTAQGEILKQNGRRSKKLDLSKFEIGNIRLQLYAYDRDPAIMNLLMGRRSQVSRYLNENGGIRVYRDGIRVYDYGERGNDWLGLDIRRVNIPGKRLSNNIVIGALFLDRESSESLKEKTNREGFIENDAYKLLVDAVLHVIGEFEDERYIDKTIIREIYGPSSKTEPVTATFEELRNKLKDNIEDKKLRDELINIIDRAESEYNEIKDVLLKSSGAGISFAIVIHEIEKILSELTKVVEREDATKRIKTLVKRLSQLTEGFATLVRRGRRRNNDLKNIIDQALFNVETRLELHNISIIDNYSDLNWNTTVQCTRNYVLMVMMNLLDNSIYWLSREYGESKGVKKIFVTITRDEEDQVTVVFADNGPGFSVPYEHAVKPFVSKKPGGMGLGLFIADEIMKAHQGKLTFPEKKGLMIPRNVNGAIVGLSFRRDNK